MSKNATLPNELILDILSCLPATSLARFRCVNQFWRYSILDPEFITNHLNRAIERDSMNIFLSSYPNPTTHIYCLEGNSFDESIHIENPIANSKILGTCNGIICLSSKNLLCLLNPCTREYKIVEFGNEFEFSHKIVYGLGFDEARDDYVLIQIVNSDDYRDMYDYHSDDDQDGFVPQVNGDLNSRVNLYSLNDCSSLHIANVPYKCDGQELGVFSKGCVYWLAKTELYSPLKIVCYYDIQKRVFRKLRPPVDKGANITLEILRGKISLLCDFYSNEIEVWMLEKHDGIDFWVKLYSMEKVFLPRGPVSRVLCFCEDGMVVLKDGKKLIRYDPKTKQVKNISNHRVDWERIGTRICHTASLVPLKTNTYARFVSGIEL